MKIIDGRVTEPFTHFFNRMMAKDTQRVFGNTILSFGSDILFARYEDDSRLCIDEIGVFDSQRNAVLLNDEFYEKHWDKYWQVIVDIIKRYELANKGVEITLERTGYHLAGGG